MILHPKRLFQEKIPRWGFDNFYRVAFEKFYRGGQKFLRSTFFSRYADCQLGGGPKKMSARGGPKMGFFSVS